MTVARDIKRALEAYADQAPPAGTVATPRLLGRIRRGRAVRQATVGVMSVGVAVTVLYGLVAGAQMARGGWYPGEPAPADPSRPGSRPTRSAPVWDPCGDPAIHPHLPPDPDVSLELTVHLPGRAVAGNAGSLRVTATVTNRSDVAVTGTTSVQPDLMVAADGRIVAVPVPQRDIGVPIALAPGASKTFDATLSLRRCAPGGSTAGPLTPGTYEVYAYQRFQLDGHGTVPVEAGPWWFTLD
jgi:hypothetical protein